MPKSPKKLPAKPIAPLPKTFGLMDMTQLAEYVGRHPTLLRKYYSQGILPEPKHRIAHATKTTRRFTIEEANAMKTLFDTMEWGTAAKIRTRSAKRKARRT